MNHHFKRVHEVCWHWAAVILLTVVIMLCYWHHCMVFTNRLGECPNINVISVIRYSPGVTLSHFTFARSMSWNGPLDIPAFGTSNKPINTLPFSSQDVSDVTIRYVKMNITFVVFPCFLHRYRKDVDGFLKVNMVRFETVEVTKEIMKNMAKKPQSLRKSQRTSSRNKRPAVTPESGRSSPAGSSSPSSSSSSSYSSELSGGEDVSSQPSPRSSDSPVYCVMSTIPHIEDEPGGIAQEDCDTSGTSGAVQALTEVARGLGMDVVWLSTMHCTIEPDWCRLSYSYYAIALFCLFNYIFAVELSVKSSLGLYFWAKASECSSALLKWFYIHFLSYLCLETTVSLSQLLVTLMPWLSFVMSRIYIILPVKHRLMLTKLTWMWWVKSTTALDLQNVIPYAFLTHHFQLPFPVIISMMLPTQRMPEDIGFYCKCNFIVLMQKSVSLLYILNTFLIQKFSWF